MHAAEESCISVPSVVVNSVINLAIVHGEEILSVNSHNQKGSSCFGVNESFLMKLSIISFRMPDGNKTGMVHSTHGCAFTNGTRPKCHRRRK